VLVAEGEQAGLDVRQLVRSVVEQRVERVPLALEDRDYSSELRLGGGEGLVDCPRQRLPVLLHGNDRARRDVLKQVNYSAMRLLIVHKRFHKLCTTN
ncbi:hypothetical protein PRIPAC_82673, partial [Pristionchus pacificus]|uniref:Uncharacterized protein n=1 Tax=Pristionchus pacificus TaxID=54126 RepID=A0A2A6BXB4_PRIPA